MVNQKILRDLKHVWHPAAPRKVLDQSPPFLVHYAKGSYLYTDRGPIIDAISSWWCKSLGHGCAPVLTAIQTQLEYFEHVIGADSTFDTLIELTETLAKWSGLPYTYFASDGSSAVEIALKLALHATQLKGAPERNEFIALQHAYHGETLATISVSDVGLYKKPYAGYGVKCHFLQGIPYVANRNEPLWDACDSFWPSIEQQLEAFKSKACALIVEPIIQGVGGMSCYSADFLARIVRWAQQNDLYVIADEMMTGLGRTGTWFAMEHAHAQADMICLGKGLTSGTLPLSGVIVSQTIYDLFYEEGFLHSHTYSGNALAVSAALATLKTMEELDILNKTSTLGDCMHHHFLEIARKTGKLTNIRSIGAIVAGDLIECDSEALKQAALKRGALFRPIGRTLYWLPPLNTDEETIEKLAHITLNSLKAVD